MEKIKIAAIQMPTVADKMENVRTVKTYLEKIKDENPDFVILPEMFCCPYQTENFLSYYSLFYIHCQFFQQLAFALSIGQFL